MPGIIYNAKPFQDQRSGLLESLPGPVRMVLDKLFPATDPLGGMAPAGMAVEAPGSLVQALSPLAKGSLQRGSELASELAGRAREFAGKPTNARYSSPAAKFTRFLDKAELDPIDPNKVAAMSKVTSARPPTRTAPAIPEGFTFSRTGIPTNPTERWDFAKRTPREPGLDRMAKIWKEYEYSQKMRFGNNTKKTIDIPPISSTSGEKPALSGRWSRNSKRGNTADMKSLRGHNKEP